MDLIIFLPHIILFLFRELLRIQILRKPLTKTKPILQNEQIVEYFL